MKTNEEIMNELQTRGRFKTAEEVDDFFLKTLEAKDLQHREDKRRLIEGIPENVGCWDQGFGCGDGGNEEIIEYKQDQLSKLKD